MSTRPNEPARYDDPGCSSARSCTPFGPCKSSLLVLVGFLTVGWKERSLCSAYRWPRTADIARRRPLLLALLDYEGGR